MTTLPAVLPARRPINRARGPRRASRMLDVSPYATPPAINELGGNLTADARYWMQGYGQDATTNRHIAASPADIVPMVTVEEDHEDDLVITEHPVEFGAAITDHSYKRPAEVRMRLGWSQSTGLSRLGDSKVSNVREIYETLLALQNSRNPFTVYTGKRTYTNMLVASIRVHTDARYEYTLLADVSLKQILLVSTQTLSATTNVASMSTPQSNAAPIENGMQQPTVSNMTGDQLNQAGSSVQYDDS
jgi:hypothetical protein